MKKNKHVPHQRHRMLGRQAQLPDSLLPSFQEASWKYQLVTYGHMQFIHGQSMSISWKQWSYAVWLGTAIIYKYQFCCVSTWPSWNCLNMSAKQLFPLMKLSFKSEIWGAVNCTTPSARLNLDHRDPPLHLTDALQYLKIHGPAAQSYLNGNTNQGGNQG